MYLAFVIKNGLLSILFCLLSLEVNAQGDSLSYHFYTLDDRYGVFQINETNGDTSYIVGIINIPVSLDTVYFTELVDTVILESGGMAGINTDPIEGVAPPKKIKFESNVITSKFMFLGGKHDLLSFKELKYVLHDSLTIFFNQEKEGDTLHMVDFTPTEFLDIRIENDNMKSDRFTHRNYAPAHTRKKNVSGMLDHIYFKFDAYCSKNPNNIDVRSLTRGKVMLGRRSYVLVIR